MNAMNESIADSTSQKLPPPVRATPWSWRIAIALAIAAVGASAYFLEGQGWISYKGQAAAGIVCFFGVAALFSANLRAVAWRTIAWGIMLQVALALFVNKLYVGEQLFDRIAAVFRKFLEFSDAGAKFVFGSVGDAKAMQKFLPDHAPVFAFSVLPTIIFVAAFFTVLYYFGILQLAVRGMAEIMRYLMGTSGAETLSVSANVFMGQTEAPLIIKPYLPRMTQSELLAMMVGGMAHISGSLLAVYMRMGANAVAILATSVMAAPCSLYLAKLMLPELGQPETRAGARATIEREHANFIDAAVAGASDGLKLALNVAAMLIAFIALIAMCNYILGSISEGLTLDKIFAWVFSPVAFLMGVPSQDVPNVGTLLGTKLTLNEFVAYQIMEPMVAKKELSERSIKLATYALTGFANFASIGIQIGGIGAIAPTRRSDLARLGPRALLTGFLVTLINASIAGLLI